MKQENLELRKELEYIRFQYIKEHKNSLNSKKASEILNVSRSGYYKYISHKPSAREIENRYLSKKS